MATKTVVFFTAGINPTTDEKTAIGKLNAAAEAPYKVLVANGAANAKYGETDRLIPTDYAAGTIPTIYGAVPVLDPDNLPGSGPTISNGDTVAVRNSAGANSRNGTAVVTGNTVTGINLPATTAMVDNSGAVSVKNSSGAVTNPGTATVAAGVITAVNLGADKAMLGNNGAAIIKNSAGGVSKTGTVTVAAGAVTGIALPATSAIVDNAAVLPVTGGGSVTITVAGGLVTGVAYTAP